MLRHMWRPLAGSFWNGVVLKWRISLYSKLRRPSPTVLQCIERLPLEQSPLVPLPRRPQQRAVREAGRVAGGHTGGLFALESLSSSYSPENDDERATHNVRHHSSPHLSVARHSSCVGELRPERVISANSLEALLPLIIENFGSTSGA